MNGKEEEEEEPKMRPNANEIPQNTAETQSPLKGLFIRSDECRSPFLRTCRPDLEAYPVTRRKPINIKRRYICTYILKSTCTCKARYMRLNELTGVEIAARGGRKSRCQLRRLSGRRLGDRRTKKCCGRLTSRRRLPSNNIQIRYHCSQFRIQSSRPLEEGASIMIAKTIARPEKYNR